LALKTNFPSNFLGHSLAISYPYQELGLVGVGFQFQCEWRGF